MEVIEVVGVGQLLAVGSANLIVTVLALRNARRSAHLAEHRVEALRAEQARLVALLREERRVWRREAGEGRARHLSLSEARRREERAHREPAASPLEKERLAEDLRLAQQERERERHARLATESRIERLEKELRELREASQSENHQPVMAGRRDASTETRGSQPSPPTAPAVDARDLYGTASKPPKGAARGGEKPGRALWHPHPDDRPGERPAPARAGTGTSSAAPGDAGTGARGGAPVEMFRKHYDKYLENYEGYVELAESLCRTRQAGEESCSPSGERELQDRLRRLKDGIERTTARLDVLEQYNPELATDDRISRRANVARRHSEILAISFQRSAISKNESQ